MGAAEHRIGRVTFDIPEVDQATLDLFGSMIRVRFDAVIAPALEAALERIDRPGAVLRFDRVEIDLGMLDTPVPEANDLARRLIHGLAGALSSASTGRSTRDEPDHDETTDLTAFLQTGVLTWPEPGRALVLLGQSLAKLDGPAMRRLATRLRPLLTRRLVAERLVRQLPAGVVRRLLRALLPDDVAAPLSHAFGADRALPQLGDAPAAAVLVPRLVAAFVAMASGRGAAEFGDIVALFAVLDERVPMATLLPALPGQARRTTPEAGKAATPETFETASEPLPPSTPVHAAGAVLLHPFLGPFFERLGLLAAPDRFRDHDTMVRAVLLAHHLATGADEAPEPETVLFKLLCGMTVADVVPRRIEIEPHEREEALSLLNSVITYWSRLGHTSPEALREAFLLRPGMLQQQDGKWRLLVERQGVDVLLDHLPWALSWVKTPFMRRPLAVDWR